MTRTYCVAISKICNLREREHIVHDNHDVHTKTQHVQTQNIGGNLINYWIIHSQVTRNVRRMKTTHNYTVIKHKHEIGKGYNNSSSAAATGCKRYSSKKTTTATVRVSAQKKNKHTRDSLLRSLRRWVVGHSSECILVPHTLVRVRTLMCPFSSSNRFDGFTSRWMIFW